MRKDFIPSLLIPEIFNPIINNNNVTADILERLIPENFYKSFEITTVRKSEERKKILELKEKNNLLITQWLTFPLEKHGFDISSLNRDWKNKSIDFIKKNIYLGAEAGASNIALVPGENPGLNLIKESSQQFTESLYDICYEARKFNINILIEPLDRNVDKNRLIGPTNEILDVIKNVKKKYNNIGLAFDTAHAALNGEDIIKSINMANSELYQIHFSNAVLEKGHKLFGDRHIPIGNPGFLNIEKISDFLKKASTISEKTNRKIPIAIEVRTDKNDDLKEKERINREILIKAIKLAEKK